ncbi:hypothetical protein LTS18_012359 [Coniosporium uncinatum]|uniref:Uncharacterized protein n=1 Tax=Coniosporium uncinatum TaxID=93489 RepID=A0ACC3CXG1_9PEZI|nr:hypothetical protein LTS18_012359 [Coniosporium uncinatum]
MQSSRWATKPATPIPDPTPAAPPASAVQEHSPALPVEPVYDTTSTYEPKFEMYTADDQADEFAQTRPPDDLFDDDFIPISAPTAPITSATSQPTPPTQPRPPTEPSSFSIRGRASRSRGGHNRTSPPQHHLPSEPDIITTASATPDAPPENAPEAATTTATTIIPTAVRGPRHLTGGTPKPKLTDAELSARLSAMSIKNRSLAEAHARAEADRQSSEKREQQAVVRRREERVNRQQMMGERERNRQRKLGARGGREWDVEKEEEEIEGRAREPGGGMRGAHGGVVGSRGDLGDSRFARVEDEQGQDQSQGQDGFEIRGNADRGRGRGRGGRGRGGRGRGDGERGGAQQRQQRQAPPTADDFPELPAKAPQVEGGAEAKVSTPSEPTNKKDLKIYALGLASPGGEKKSWADQVEGTMSP